MTNTTLLLGLIVGAVVFSGMSLGDAEAAVFAKYDGIDGESKDTDHGQWIDVLSVDWGAHKKNAGETTSKRGSAVLVQDMSMTVEYEKASPKLQEKCLNGEIIPKLEIEQTASYGGSRATYLKYELKNVIITSFQVNTQGFDETPPGTNPPLEGLRPTMDLTLNFEDIEVTYFEYDDRGNLLSETGYSMSIKKNGRASSSTTPTPSSYEIPEWYRSNISWQHQGLISPDEVLRGLEYLKQQNILTL